METAHADTSPVSQYRNEEVSTERQAESTEAPSMEAPSEEAQSTGTESMETESTETGVVRLPITTSWGLIRAVEILWKEWVATYQHQNIRWALSRCNRLVTNAVAFELGSPITYPGVTAQLILQHCLLLAACDSLGVPLRTQLACVSQSCSYTEEDCQALYEFGIQACTEFGGFLRIDHDSVVVSMYPDIVVQELATSSVRPAVIICVKIETR